MILQTSNTTEIIEFLNSDKIGIMPTDTIYGIHCKALNDDLISRVYEIKNRPDEVPLITVISNISQLALFGVKIGDFEKNKMDEFWPGPNTLVFNTSNGTRSFRLPDNDFLLSVVNETGPLISTSANLHKIPPAKSINEAINYFGDKIDFYVDGGELNNPPSSVYKILDGEVEKLR